MLDPLSVEIPLASPQTEDRSKRPVRKLLRPSSDNPDDYILELSYSGLAAFMECPRKFENHYINTREATRDTSAMDFGDLFHRLEEKRFRAGGIKPEVHLDQISTIAEHFVHKPSPVGDHRTSNRMVEVIQKYNEIYATDGWVKKIYHDTEGPFIERAFKIELTTIKLDQYIPYDKTLLCNEVGDWKSKNGLYVNNIHILYRGIIDLVLEENNMLWVPDHKTTSRGGKEFLEAFRLSLQTRSYCWAAQKILGRPVAGLILNGVVVRPLTKTGVGTEFNRATYFYSPDSLEECEQCMKAVASDIIANLIRGFFPQHARSFISPCAHCDYSDNCSLPKHQRAADLASDLYRDVKVSSMKE